MDVYTVTQVARYLRNSLESDSLLSDIWVRGEVSNLSHSPAGHSYFTLKDENSQLACVIFRSSRSAQQLLQNGAEVVAHGYVSFYEVRGQLQFYVDVVQPQGVGALYLEFERLKAKLEAEGLFDLARKRPLPRFPQRIGLITSPTGAVRHDIQNIIARRFPLVELVFCPTPVQGDGAAEGIVQAFEAFQMEEGIDVIILARGGGSLEELWPFNEEKVARAIFACKYPVVSAVGHETDFTIADFVADLRAPTPSAAAELVVPDRQELLSHIHSLRKRAFSAFTQTISQRKDNVREKLGLLKAFAPDVRRERQRIDELARASLARFSSYLSLKRESVRSLAAKLVALSPQSALARGYALVQRSDTGEVVCRVVQVKGGDAINILISDGSFKGEVKE